jgi:arylsulfatase A-like enzyme
MLTGRYPTSTGVLGNRDNLMTIHPEFVTIPRMFKENGYASLRTGKVFHGIAAMDDPKGWTEGGANQGGEVEPETNAGSPIYALQSTTARATDRNSREWLLQNSTYANAGMTQAQRSDRWAATPGEPAGPAKAIDYLNRYKDKQFFIACGFSKPHSPLEAPVRFFEMYDWNKIQLPVDYAPKPTIWPGFPQGSIRPRNADLFIGRDSTVETAKDMFRAYLACTSYSDWNVGQVMAELDRLGLTEKTIIVFWGDHGYQLGEKGKWSKAGSVWEQGARVPFIIRVPGMAGNTKSSPRVVESVDIYRTLAELCGLPVQEGVEGRSLVPLLKDPQLKWDHPAYTVWSEDNRTLTAVAVRNEKYRYAEFTAGTGGAMLLDEAADPNEVKNLADDPAYASVRAEMSKLVQEHKAKWKPPQ